MTLPTTTTAPARLPVPLAEDAATAARPAGPCALCAAGIRAGERYARLRTGKLAHLPCIGRASAP
jgi:hypothetical protein